MRHVLMLYTSPYESERMGVAGLHGQFVFLPCLRLFTIHNLFARVAYCAESCSTMVPFIISCALG